MHTDTSSLSSISIIFYLIYLFEHIFILFFHFSLSQFLRHIATFCIICIMFVHFCCCAKSLKPLLILSYLILSYVNGSSRQTSGSSKYSCSSNRDNSCSNTDSAHQSYLPFLVMPSPHLLLVTCYLLSMRASCNFALHDFLFKQLSLYSM